MRIRTLPKNFDKEEEAQEERQQRLRRKARRRKEEEEEAEERESGLRREPLMLQRGSIVPTILTDSAAIFSLSLSNCQVLYRFGVIYLKI